MKMEKTGASRYYNLTRRSFIKRVVLGAGSVGVGVYSAAHYYGDLFSDEFSRAFINDGPDKLWKWHKEAESYVTLDNCVQCTLCPHECMIGHGDRGYCRTRVNLNNTLYSIAYGNPCSYHIDPIEKKPLFHFLPGTGIFSIATAGCNLRCNNCQNWQISQTKPEKTINADMFPQKVADKAIEARCESIAYTYSEPIIFYEYVYDTSIIAKDKGIKNVLVTGGYINEEPLKKLARVVDAANVDLKGFSDDFYIKATGGRIAPVLKAIEILADNGVWIEITNLIVPTLNDSPSMIKNMTNWIVKTLGPETPLHLSRFYPDYKLKHLPPTPIKTLIMARDIARESGLLYVYIGNVYGKNFQVTECRNGHTVVKREGYTVVGYNLDSEGRCATCHTSVAGVWTV